jgi:hypothetical protein
MLKDRERMTLSPDSRLREERRAAVFEPGRDGDAGDERCECRTGARRHQYIERALAGIRLRRRSLHVITLPR